MRDRRRRERLSRGLGDRNLYVLEATPRRDRIREALQGKTVLYIDSEMWFEPYVDTYDRRGQLFQNNIYWLAYRDRPVPDAKVAIYPFKREFVVASAQTDVQGGLRPCASCRRRKPPSASAGIST